MCFDNVVFDLLNFLKVQTVALYFNNSWGAFLNAPHKQNLHIIKYSPQGFIIRVIFIKGGQLPTLLF